MDIKEGCSNLEQEKSQDILEGLSGKERRYAAIKALLTAFYDDFPDCFKVEAKARKPLAIGVSVELKAHFRHHPCFSTQFLHGAVNMYVSSIGYLRNCIEGAARVGLDGKPQGIVSEEEAAFAKVQLKEARKRLNARKKKREPTQEKEQAKKATGQRFSTKLTLKKNVVKAVSDD